MPRWRRQSFSAEFKAQIVLEDLSGARSHTEAARRHKLKPELITCLYQSMIDRATPDSFPRPERRRLLQAATTRGLEKRFRPAVVR
jgi:transposase-like protein